MTLWELDFCTGLQLPCRWLTLVHSVYFLALLEEKFEKQTDRRQTENQADEYIDCERKRLAKIRWLITIERERRGVGYDLCCNIWTLFCIILINCTYNCFYQSDIYI